MATRDTGQLSSGISRRDFLKTSAAITAVAGCGLDFAFDAEKAAAYEDSPAHTITTTTCPYCSASCGQRVVKEDASGKIVDIYGDFESPMNNGGLCSKGASGLQLVNNPRRIGAWTFPYAGLAAHPAGAVFEAIPEAGDFASGVAYRREGNGAWSAVGLDAAMTEAAQGMLAARGTVDASNGYNSKQVAFFGSSHMNNEENYLYRKTIAAFGTTNTEHQARI
jgi:formate dehydrogenase major subunit